MTQNINKMKNILHWKNNGLENQKININISTFSPWTVGKITKWLYFTNFEVYGKEDNSHFSKKFCVNDIHSHSGT